MASSRVTQVGADTSASSSTPSGSSASSSDSSAASPGPNWRQLPLKHVKLRREHRRLQYRQLQHRQLQHLRRYHYPLQHRRLEHLQIQHEHHGFQRDDLDRALKQLLADTLELGVRKPSANPSSSSGVPRSDGGGTLWTPSSAEPIHFHWMIGGFTTADILPNQSGPAVYDIDGEGSTAADVAAIHAAGAIAVCYVDVGTLEQGRSDYNQFPASVIGPVVQGWPQENWLLVTAANQSIILPLMQARFKNWCQAKGFDGIEPDNLDGWTNISEITQADNVTYDMAIGSLAHELPLSIGLKNVLTDVSGMNFSNLVSRFDWALNEQCYEYDECSSYTQAGSFLASGKAVWDVEYNVSPNCTQADAAHLNAQRTDLDLVGATASGYSYTPCVPDAQSTW